jgi:hypothetical protein
METPVTVTVEPVVEKKRALRRLLARFPRVLMFARLVAETVRVCLRYRVTGLAAEAGFFALLSFPPLVLGLFGGVGYFGTWIGDVTIDSFIRQIQTYAGTFLTQDIIDDLLLPTVSDVFRGGPRRSDLDRIRARAVVGLAGAERLRRHDFDHVWAVRRPRDRAHPDVELHALSGEFDHRRHRDPVDVHRPDLAGADPAGSPRHPGGAVLARRHGAGRGDPDDALSHRHAQEDPVGAGPARCRR